MSHETTTTDGEEHDSGRAGSPSRFESLRRRATDRPIGTLLVATATYSMLVVGTLYAALGTALPGLSAIPYAWGPLVGAGVTVWLLEEDVRGWLGQLRNLRVGLRWYLVGAGIMIAGTEFESIVAVVLGGDVTGLNAPPIAYALQFGITLLLAGALEELGWRGFMQPRLQRRFRALTASVAVGVTWAIWHVPMIVAGVGSFPAFHEYAASVVAISILFAWLYNSTGGAIPVVMIAHASHNMPSFVAVSGEAPAVFDVLSGDVVLYCACAVVVSAYAGAQRLTRDGALPAVPGRSTGSSTLDPDTGG